MLHHALFYKAPQPLDTVGVSLSVFETFPMVYRIVDTSAVARCPVPAAWLDDGLPACLICWNNESNSWCRIAVLYRNYLAAGSHRTAPAGHTSLQDLVHTPNRPRTDDHKRQHHRLPPEQGRKQLHPIYRRPLCNHHLCGVHAVEGLSHQRKAKG